MAAIFDFQHTQTSDSLSTCLPVLRLFENMAYRTFFLAFVLSQFHGSQIITFPVESMEKVLMVFLRSCFSLPTGYPRAIFYSLLDIDKFLFSQIRAWRRFFSRNVRSAIRPLMREVFLHDRELFHLGLPSWSQDFGSLFERFYTERMFSEIDLFDEEQSMMELLRTESMSHRNGRMTLSPSAHLFQVLLPYRVNRPFLAALSARSFEEVRLMLLFWGNMLRYCLFNGVVEFCLLCNAGFTSEHFLSCTEVNSGEILGNWREMLANEKWDEFISFFFLIALEWMHRTNRVRVGHQKTIERANGLC